MTSSRPAGFLPVNVAGDLQFSDLGRALAAGWADFRACPAFGLFFGAIYMAGGLALSWVLFGQGNLVWLVPAAGFPLLAPFSAVGLYEVSRLREKGETPGWGQVLGAIRGRGDGQVLGMGVIAFVIFCFWVILAHGIFYIFLSQSGLGAESWAFLSTSSGVMMLLVGSAVGAALAMLVYAIMLVSLPMLLDRDVDSITATITSVTAVRRNTGVLLCWALLIAGLLFVAMVPAFAGLLVVLPVLAHASWHMYRRIVS